MRSGTIGGGQFLGEQFGEREGSRRLIVLTQ